MYDFTEIYKIINSCIDRMIFIQILFVIENAANIKIQVLLKVLSEN